MFCDLAELEEKNRSSEPLLLNMLRLGEAFKAETARQLFFRRNLLFENVAAWKAP